MDNQLIKIPSNKNFTFSRNS